MPTYSISAPDGQTYQIDGPAGASDDQVRAEVLRQHPTAGTARAAAKPDIGSDVAKSYGTGLKQGATGIADQVATMIPGLSQVHRVASDLWAATHNQLPSTNANLFSAVGSALVPDHAPQTWQGRTALTAGQLTPAAASPGNVFSRAASVIVPTVTSSAAGEAARAMGASPGVESAARLAGAIGGGVLSSARITPKAAPGSEDRVANVFASRAGADPEAMSAQADAMRSTGVEPTLLDVTGQKGLRLARAVGVTNDNAGEALQNNATAISSTTKPAVMARTRSIASDARTADQVAADLSKARTTEARTTYAEPYAAKVDLKDPEVIQALRDPEGASAINRAITAARARMDYSAVADLNALKATANGPTGDAQVWPTTGRALDRVQIAFGNKGQALAQNGSNDIASGMFKRQEIINGALDNVEGLQPARAAFRAKSQAIDLLTKPGARKDPFSTDPTDYKAWVDSLPPEAQHANQVGIRQDILDTLGGQRSGTAGSIDELATSQYARQNLAHALGPKAADDYLANLTARLRQRSNATFASPNGGSRTAVLQNDTAGLDRALSVADAAHKVATGNVFGLAAKASAWLKTRGLSDTDAEALAKASIDPARLDSVVSAIRRLKDPKTAQGFVNFHGGLLGSVRGGTMSQTPQSPAPR